MTPYERSLQAALLRGSGGPSGPGTQLPYAQNNFSAGGPQTGYANRGSRMGQGTSDFATGAFKLGKSFFTPAAAPAAGTAFPQASGATVFAAGPETAIGAAAGNGAAAAPGIGGSAGGAAGGGWGSMLSSAGPWAALIAAIVGNEMHAKNSNYNYTDSNGVEQKEGLRSDDKLDYWKDLLSGNVLTRDLEKRYLPKLNDKIDGFQSSGLGNDAVLMSKIGSLHWKDIGKDDLKKTSLGRLLRKIF